MAQAGAYQSAALTTRLPVALRSNRFIPAFAPFHKNFSTLRTKKTDAGRDRLVLLKYQIKKRVRHEKEFFRE